MGALGPPDGASFGQHGLAVYRLTKFGLEVTERVASMSASGSEARVGGRPRGRIVIAKLVMGLRQGSTSSQVGENGNQQGQSAPQRNRVGLVTGRDEGQPLALRHDRRQDTNHHLAIHYHHLYGMEVSCLLALGGYATQVQAAPLNPPRIALSRACSCPVVRPSCGTVLLMGTLNVLVQFKVELTA